MSHPTRSPGDPSDRGRTAGTGIPERWSAAVVGRPASRAYVRTRAAYESYVDEIERCEGALGDELPFATRPADVAERLAAPIEGWATGAKQVRVVPAIVAIEAATDHTVSRELVGRLVGLDVSVTALDDVVDERNLGRDDRLELATIATFGLLLSTERRATGLPTLRETIREYYLTMAQVPGVERRAADELASSTDLDHSLECAVAVYDYRSRDIAPFAEIPAAAVGMDDRVAARVAGDLRSFRARQLLYDDLRDVETDIENGTRTPVVELLSRAPDSDAAVDFVDRVADAFAYSEASGAEYRDALVALERRPADVERLLSDGRGHLERGR